MWGKTKKTCIYKLESFRIMFLKIKIVKTLNISRSTHQKRLIASATTTCLHSYRVQVLTCSSRALSPTENLKDLEHHEIKIYKGDPGLLSS